MMPVRLEDQEEEDAKLIIKRNNHNFNSNNNNNNINNNINNQLGADPRSQMKKRSKSEKRHYKDKSSGTSDDRLRSTQHQNHETVVLDRTTSSVDSGAGVEDDESGGSHTASEEIGVHGNNQKLQLIRQISDLGSDRPTSPSSSLRRKTSAKRSKSQSAGERLSRHNTATSDSAVSTSILSTTSGLSTPTESRIFSSPNLSDHSKTSFSPKHSSTNSKNYPPLTKALRKKQERLKRELEIKEARFQLERQRFMEEAYRPLRGGSLKRRDSAKGSGSASVHRVLQKSYSVDSSVTPSGNPRESTPSTSPRSKKNEPRKLKKEFRSKSVGRDGTEKELAGRETLSSPRNKEGYSVKGDSSSAENKIQTVSQSSIQTATSSTSKNSSGGEPLHDSTNNIDNEIDNDSRNVNNENKYSDKKQKRKSRRDRSSSSRRRRHESQERSSITAGHVVDSTSENQKTSTDSDDVFDNMATKLELTTGREVSNEDFEKRMNQAVDSIQRDGMPDIPTTEQITETGLLDWRAVFRVEMMRLRREVNEFRSYCQNQVENQATDAWRRETHQNTSSENQQTFQADEVAQDLQDVSKAPPIVANQLKDLQANMKLFQKKQQLLDLETDLLSQEERLAEKQNHLEEYEKEILEVESMLNHRQAICDRRQKTLLNLDEELQTLRSELEETREQMQVDGSIPESNSERARKNWDMVKRNLMDEQKLLETTVQKYRSELASATSTIAGKDILISRLQSVAMQHEEEIAVRDKRIKQLESKLSIALSETKSLRDQVPSVSQQTLNASKSALESEMGSSAQRPGMSSEGSTTGNLENNRLTSFRSTRSFYRRPSSNAASDQGDDYATHRGVGGGGATAGGVDGGGMMMNGDAGGTSRNSFRNSVSARKRNSVSDNAISRLTLSTPRTEGTSSACVVQ